MKHIKQFTEIDCGFAVAAMLAGVEYLEALDLDPAPDEDRGLRVAEMADLLQTLTRKQWAVSKRHYQKPLSAIGLDAVVKDGPIALLLRRPEVTFGHWVACTKERIHDPEFARPRVIKRYDRADWRVIRIISPCWAQPSLITSGLF